MDRLHLSTRFPQAWIILESGRNTPIFTIQSGQSMFLSQMKKPSAPLNIWLKPRELSPLLNQPTLWPML